MTAGVAPAGNGPTVARLQHWIFGSAPGTGYGVVAQTPDLNLGFYAKRLDGIYTPLTGENLHGDEAVVDVLMAHPASSGTELLLSWIGPGPTEEEFHRRTFVNHTVVAPVAPLRDGRLGFAAIEEAVRTFDRSRVRPTGSLEPLVVPLVAGRGPGGWAETGVRRYLSNASAETLLTRMLTAPDDATLVLSRQSSPAERRETLYRILETFHLACGLPFVSSLSDAPALPVVSRFQLVVAARAIRTDGSWALLDNTLESPTLPRVVGQESRYAALDRCYGTGSDPA
jgi:hypothetical protein